VEDESPPDARSIGRWVDKNRGDYFVKPVIRPGKVANPFINQLSQLNNFLYGQQATEIVIEGFSVTAEMPFNHIRSRLEPKFPNSTPEEGIVVPILSRTEIRLFWAFSHFEYVDWGSVRRIEGLEWSTGEAPLKNAGRIDEIVSGIVTKFWSFVEEPLRAKWGLGPASVSAESGAPS